MTFLEFDIGVTFNDDGYIIFPEQNIAHIFKMLRKRYPTPLDPLHDGSGPKGKDKHRHGVWGLLLDWYTDARGRLLSPA